MSPQPIPPRIAVLVSGTGTLLEAMIEDHVPIDLVLVDKKCRALEIADDAGIPTVVVLRTDFGYYKDAGEDWDREGFTKAVIIELRLKNIDLVAMAGFMTVFSPVMFEAYGGRVLNSHPALLPDFRGGTAVEDTLAAGRTETGCTIHIATEIMDDSRFIVRQVHGIPVKPNDTEETLWERIKVEERKLYPEVLHKVISGEIDLAKIYTDKE